LVKIIRESYIAFISAYTGQNFLNTLVRNTLEDARDISDNRKTLENIAASCAGGRVDYPNVNWLA